MRKDLGKILQSEQSPQYNIPVIDCPLCNAKKVPVSYIDGFPPVPFCMQCKCFLPTPLTVLGYVSYIDIESDWEF